MTRLLGAVLAGGRSSRFGSDKALALWRGRPLIDWAVEALAGHADTVLICGREDGLPDRPAGRLGPLAGINAALHHARDHGFDTVLSLPCDTPSIGPETLGRLCGGEGGAAYLADSPVTGAWPSALAAQLDTHLLGPDRSMRGWIRAIGARAIVLDTPLPNINTPEDLDRLVKDRA